MTSQCSPLVTRLAALVAALCLLTLAVSGRAATGVVASTAPAPGPGDANPALYAPVLPELRDEIYKETAGRLTRYRVDAILHPAGAQPATITGTLALSYYNHTGEEQRSLYFRLYPNATEYREGGMELGTVLVADRPRLPRLGVDDTLARIALPEPVAPGETVDLQLTFTTTIPTDPVGSYGMFGFDSRRETYALAHWLPLLAGYDPASGWNLAPLSALGDPIFSDIALFDVTITAPSELIVVTTGSEIEVETTGERTRRRIVSGPVRDFAMAASPHFLSDSIEVDGTTVTSFYLPESESGGLAVLVFGVQSLEVFNRLFGPYPYERLNLVQIGLGGGAAGVEFPQLMFIGADHYGDSALTRRIPGFLEFVVAHEVAHQWWYGLVGNNQYVHAFLDEGLTNYVSTIYFADQYGSAAAAEQVNINLKLPYFWMLFGDDGDQIVNQPTDAFPSQAAYAATVYGKAALGFAAIRQEIGDDAFFDALQDYAGRFRFKIATPDDLREAFERASGQDLSGIWWHWFEAKNGRQDFDAADLERVLRELGR